MGALWRKDMPWLLSFGVGGVIALTVAVGDGGFGFALPFATGRNDTEFHTAWILGLALGVVAALFDPALGAAEYLRQRPLSDGRLFAHRLRAILLVIALWFVAVPPIGWLWMVVFEQAGFAVELDALVDIWLAFVPALSAAAIGLFAMLLPAPWWLRPAVAAATLLGTFGGIDRLSVALSDSPDGFHSASWFLALHLLAAVVFAVLAWTCRSVRADADRPWPMRVRLGAGTVVAASLLVLPLAALQRCEGSALWAVSRRQPMVVAYDGELRLIAPHETWYRAEVRFVDDSGEPTGEVAPRGEVRDILEDRRGPDASWLEFDAPRWCSVEGARFGATSILVRSTDGEVAIRTFGAGRRSFERSGIGPERRPFAGEVRLVGQSSAGQPCVLAWERDIGRIYRFDAELGWFVGVTLPDGDRPVGMIHERSVSWLGGSKETPIAVRGEHGVYVPRGDTFVAAPAGDFDRSDQRAAGSPPRFGTSTGGPFARTLTVAADGDRPAWQHVFRPHGFEANAFAAVAVGLAAFAPPALAAWVPISAPFALTLGVALLAAWVAFRRLRRLGAPASVRGYWALLCAALGPLALLASVVLERPRAHVVHAPRPARAPLVFTPLLSQENPT
ncbi:MAG: hypothetical protein KDE27_21475 [Planctomycetes bacterium]|nr:hypothetical protein [Planctomycetota bacterium]